MLEEKGLLGIVMQTHMGEQKRERPQNNHYLTDEITESLRNLTCIFVRWRNKCRQLYVYVALTKTCLPFC